MDIRETTGEIRIKCVGQITVLYQCGFPPNFYICIMATQDVIIGGWG